MSHDGTVTDHSAFNSEHSSTKRPSELIEDATSQSEQEMDSAREIMENCQLEFKKDIKKIGIV